MTEHVYEYTFYETLQVQQCRHIVNVVTWTLIYFKVNLNDFTTYKALYHERLFQNNPNTRIL